MDNTTDDNNEDLLNEANHQFSLAILPVTIIIGLESAIGFIGNILIILVYSKQRDKSNFRYFVLFLAVNDLTSCTTCIPLEVFTQLNWFKISYTWICKTKVYFNLLTSWNSASILLLFSFDRFRKIMFPLKVQIRPSLAFKLCVGLTILSALVVVPGVLGWAPQTYPLPTTGGPVNVTVCGKSDELPNGVYTFLLYFYVLGILFMMFLITLLNLLTARKIFCGKRMLTSKTGGGTVEFRSSIKDSSVVTTVTEMVSTTDVQFPAHDDIDDIGNHSFTDIGHVEDSREPSKLSDSESDEDVKLAAIQRHGRDNDTPRYRKALESTTSHADEQFDRKKSKRSGNSQRTKKLIIMFVLTMVFVVTMTMYVSVTQVIAPKLNNNSLSDKEKVIFFILWRMYFVNYMVNPFLYGFMDQRFRTGLKYRLCGR